MTSPPPVRGWDAWRESVRQFVASHDLLPTPTSSDLEIPYDLIADAWMTADRDAEQLPAVCRVHEALGDPVDRGSTVLFAWHFAHDEPFLRLPEAEEAVRQEAVNGVLREVVTAFPVDQIRQPWLLRWELMFAAGIREWDRVESLVRQWITVDPGSQDRAKTELARIHVMSVHPADKTDWVLDWWATYEGSEYSFAGELLSSIYALKLDERAPLTSAKWTLPHELSAAEIERVRVAEAAASSALESAPADPVLNALVAWCTAVLGVKQNNPGQIRDAADRYAAIARERRFVKPLLDHLGTTVRFPAWSAAMLYRLAGALDDARAIAEVWTSEDAHAPDAWKFRAEIERLIGTDQWPDIYMEYVRLAPETDTSWEHTELLRLLLESQDRLAADRALRDLALTHSDRPAVAAMCAWDWPAFTKLAPETRERWWEGLVFICDERIRAVFSRPAWRHAAECFAEAVALELRVRIFAPFAQSGAVKPDLLPDRERRLATAVLNSRASLGTLIEALDLVAGPKGHLGQELDRFLRSHHRPLRGLALRKAALQRLREVRDSRNRAAHADVAPEEARSVYDEAKSVLTILAEEDARTAQMSPSAET